LSASQFSKGEGYYVRVAYVFLWAGLAHAGAAVALHYGVLHLLLGDWVAQPIWRMVGLLAQPNLLGIYIFCSFVSLVFLVAKGRLGLVGACPATLFLGFVLAGIASRAVTLYLIISIFALWLARSGLNFRARTYLLLCMLLLLGIPLYLQVDEIVRPAMVDLGYIPHL